MGNKNTEQRKVPNSQQTTAIVNQLRQHQIDVFVCSVGDGLLR